MISKCTRDKLRGGFYTPKIVSDFLVDWAQIDNNSQILETSCGDGVFLSSICNKFSELNFPKEEICSHLIGIELIQEEAAEAIRTITAMNIPDAQKIVFIGDFFKYCNFFLKSNRKFSIITGNPPFIRYQDFPKESKELAFKIINELFNFKLSAFANTWIAFLLLSTQLLEENGKIAMVIPAQLFQVNYATDTRRFLSVFFSKLTIIAFEKLIFPQAEQEVVLLMGERNNGSIEGIRVIELKDENDLYLRIKPEDISKNFHYYKYKPMDHSNEKWIQYFLDSAEIELLRKISNQHSIKKGCDLYSVDIGVVTGQNNFFILSKSDLKRNGIEPRYTERIVGKSFDLNGIMFSEDDWEKTKEKENRCYLFSPPQTEYEAFPDSIKDYIKKGLQTGVEKGYKCRIRKEHWYRVPSTYRPDGFMLRQIHDYPRIILNSSSSTCTDTIHRVKFKDGIDGSKIAGAFLNSLTFAFSEVKGRSYGGGVLTLEPSEAEQLCIPTIGIDQLNIQKIDENIKKNNIIEVIDSNDEILLRNGLSMDNAEIEMLRNIWIKLRNRRNNRNRSQYRL
jgi:adenine-specific DNA-methyltransferase